MVRLMCTKCNEEAKKVNLKEYEQEKGIILKNVEAYACPDCKEFIFTPEQMETIEKRTLALKVHMFKFQRKLTISGRSLVVNVPEDMVRHMKLKKGQKIDLRPIDDKRFLVEVK